MGPQLHFYDKYALNFVLPTAAKIPLRIQSVPNCGDDCRSWVRLTTLFFSFGLDSRLPVEQKVDYKYRFPWHS